MIEYLTLEDSDRWEKIIKTFSNYDVYYLPQYVKAFKIHGDGEPILIYYHTNELRGMNVLMKRDISEVTKFQTILDKNQYYDFATPYGYGGFTFEGNLDEENINTCIETYKKFCTENNIICEFVRFHPLLKNEKLLVNNYEVKYLGKTVSIDLKSEDYIWENITSKNRNVIRKAIKNGVEIYSGKSDKLMEKFVDMYNATMDKYENNDYYYFKNSFYESMKNDLGPRWTFFYAMFEGEIIAMSMILLGQDYIHYHLSSTDDNYKKLSPTNLLLYEVAKWGANEGYKVLHLGGGLGSKQDSLYKFKKSFNKNYDLDYAIGSLIFDNDNYEYLVEKSGLNHHSNDYFPKYRI